jgi:hypothetical protein
MNIHRFLQPAYHGVTVALALAGGLYANPGQTDSASLAGFYLPGFGANGYKT